MSIKQLLCEHDYFFVAEICVGQGQMKNLYRCKKCGMMKTELRDTRAFVNIYRCKKGGRNKII